MINKKLREKINRYAEEEDLEITLFENPSFDNSIIGISHNGKLIYDYDKMVKELSADDEISFEDADDFIQYNTIRALPYCENPPIVVWLFSKNKIL